MRTRDVAVPAYQKWLDDGAHLTPRAISTVVALMRRDNKDGNGRGDGSGRFRSSLIGGCERKQVLSYVGAEQNNFDRSLVTNGTWNHYKWQAAGLSAGFLKRIEIRTSKTIRGVRLGGQADGILSDGSLLELKTANLGVMKSVAEEPMKEHVMQTNLYLGLLGLKVASLVYEERGFGNMLEYEVEFDSVLFHKTVMDAAANKSIGDTGDLPMMDPACTPKSWMRTGCTFRDTCLYRWVNDE